MDCFDAFPFWQERCEFLAPQKKAKGEGGGGDANANEDGVRNKKGKGEAF